MALFKVYLETSTSSHDLVSDLPFSYKTGWDNILIISGMDNRQYNTVSLE